MTGSSDQKQVGREVVKAFYRGLVEPSIASLIGIVVFVAIAILVCSLLITPGFVANLEPGLLMKRPRDDYAHLSAQALQMKENGSGPSVVLIGASSLKHGLVDVSQLEAMLSDDLGQTISVYNLTAPQLKVWEVASIVDFLDDPGKHIFVLSLSAKKLAVSRRDLARLKRKPRLGFQTSAFNEELVAYGIRLPFRTDNYFLDNLIFFLSRYESLLHIFTGPVIHERYQDEDVRIPEDKWEEHMLKMQGFFAGYPEMHESNLEVLSRMIVRARRAGSRVVFIQPPLNPRAAEYIAEEIRAGYGEDVVQFAEHENVPYWNLDAEMNYSDPDFHDWTHIRNEKVRLAYSELLVSHLGVYMKKNGGDNND